MKITDEMVEAACKVWNGSFQYWTDDFQNMEREKMRAALEAAVADVPEPTPAPAPTEGATMTLDPYMRIIDLFDKDDTAGSFLRDDGDGGFSGAVYRMAREIDRARAALAAPAPEAVKDDAREIISELVRLADMGLAESLLEPEGNGNYAAYERAKRYISNAEGK